MAPKLAKGIRNHLFWFSFDWLPCSDGSEDSLPGTYGARGKDPTVLLVDNSGSGTTRLFPILLRKAGHSQLPGKLPLCRVLAPQMATKNLDQHPLHPTHTVTQVEPMSETSKA